LLAAVGDRPACDLVAGRRFVNHCCFPDGEIFSERGWMADRGRHPAGAIGPVMQTRIAIEWINAYFSLSREL
jgi:hypothetical protein